MNFNVWTFLLEIVNFLVLAAVLHRLLYRPLRAAVERRRGEYEAAQAAADANRRASETARTQAEAELRDVEHRRLELLEQARGEADARRTQLLARAEAEAETRLAESRRTVEDERREMFAALEDDVFRAARTLAERLLRESVGTSLDEQLAARLAETLEAAANDARTRAAVDGGADAPILESAAELTAPARERLERAVAALATTPLPVVRRTNPDLLGGVRLRIGGAVWDATLAGQLEQARRR